METNQFWAKGLFPGSNGNSAHQQDPCIEACDGQPLWADAQEAGSQVSTPRPQGWCTPLLSQRWRHVLHTRDASEPSLPLQSWTTWVKILAGSSVSSG